MGVWREATALMMRNYIPFLLSIQNEQELLEKAASWGYFSNLVRPHYGKGMEGKTPFEKLKELGYHLPEEFAVFPPVTLDTISTDWLLETGNDLLAHYTNNQPTHC